MTKKEGTSLLTDVKHLLEVDDLEVYDRQLGLYIESGLADLRNNGVPLEAVKPDTPPEGFTGLADGDYATVCSWMHLYCYQRFDRVTSGDSDTARATRNWISEEKTHLLYQLKARYDAD